MVSRSKPVATDPEEVVDDAVHGCNALQMGRRLEAAHLPLALAGRLMRPPRPGDRRVLRSLPARSRNANLSVPPRHYFLGSDLSGTDVR